MPDDNKVVILSVDEYLRLTDNNNKQLQVGQARLNHIRGRAEYWLRSFYDGDHPIPTRDDMALEVMKNDIPWLIEHIEILESEMNAIDNKYREFKDALQRVLST